MKKLVVGLVVGLGALLVLGVALEARKSPEQKAADAEQARQYAAERAEKRAEEQAKEELKRAVNSARDVLELAYIQRVKDAEASHVSCRETEFNKRFFVRCGVAYGSPETTSNGLWETTTNNGKLVFYAMNGDALRALEKIGAGTDFQSGVDRPRVDAALLSERF